MFDPAKVPAYLRTIVPALWGSLLAWLFVQIPAIPDVWQAWLNGPSGQAFASAAVIGLWYAFWRWLEPRLPAWFTRLVLGSNLTPTYGDPGDGGDGDSLDAEPAVFNPEPVDWDNEVGPADITAAQGGE